MKDLRSIYGSNLYKISHACGINIHEITPYIVKQNLLYFSVPERETWRIPVINELMSVKVQTHVLDCFTPEEIESMLVLCCTT